MSRRIGITKGVVAANVAVVALVLVALTAGPSAIGIAAVALAIALIAAETWFVLARIVAPLRRFLHLAEQVTKGDLTVRGQAEQAVELDELAAGFNEMAVVLEARRASLEAVNRGAEAALVLAVRELARRREIDEVKDAFIATVSTELHEPLTSTRGFLDLMLAGEGGTLPAEQRRFATVTLKNTERLLRLVDDLLLVAQLEAGALQLELREVDVVELAAESVESARSAAEAGGLELEFTTRGAPIVFGDRARLAELLDNLISNAIKFTSSGGRVGVEVEAAHDRVDILVRDTGEGLTEEELGQLYTRYFRTARAGRTRVVGKGLAIAACKAIAEAHNGTIAAQSVVGRGTTFRVELPAR